jgi:hypothetical protein
MGQPKLTSHVAKSATRPLAGVQGDPKPIVERLAHATNLRQARRTDSPPLAALEKLRPMPDAPALAAGNVTRRRGLLIGGIGLALLTLCLALGALWLGFAAITSKPEAETPSAVLTAPDRIEATGGEPVSFPVALDGTDGVPPRSVIAVRGLPQGGNFSEGRPYGEGEWNLRPDQIGDLTLILPASASGEFTLTIALIDPGDKVIAEAKTLLAVASAPPSQMAVEQASLSPPVSAEAPTPGTVPDTGETAALGSAPDAGLGSGGSEMTERSEASEAAIAPPNEAPAENLEQAAVTHPSGDTRPNTVGQSDDDGNGLGTVEPSAFVNLREAPSSSSPVLGVVAKGVKLAVLDRKRGWVQVTDPATGKQGWIYGGLLAGETKSNLRVRRVAPAETEAKSESFWGRLGRWLSPSKESKEN